MAIWRPYFTSAVLKSINFYNNSPLTCTLKLKANDSITFITINQNFVLKSTFIYEIQLRMIKKVMTLDKWSYFRLHMPVMSITGRTTPAGFRQYIYKKNNKVSDPFVIFTSKRLTILTIAKSFTSNSDVEKYARVRQNISISETT